MKQKETNSPFHWLQAPRLANEDDNPLAFLIHIFLLVTLLATLVYTLGAYFILESPQLLLAVNLTLMGLQLILLGLLRRGLVIGVARTVLIAYWLFVSFHSYVLLGFSGAMVIGYPLIVIAAGILLGRPAAIVAAGVSFGASLLFVYLEIHYPLPAGRVGTSATLNWLISLIAIPVATLLWLLANRRLDAVLSLVQKNSLALAEKQQQLALEVLERQQAESRLHTVIANAPIMVWNVTPAGILTLIEGQQFNLLDIQTNKAIGRPAGELFAPLIPNFASNLEKALQGESVVALSNNGRLALETHYTPLKNKANQIIGVIGVALDITKRQRPEIERLALLEIMQGAISSSDLPAFLSLVHRAVSRVIYAENFFVALYNKESELFEEAYSIDKYDQPSSPYQLGKSISAYVFRTGQAVLLTPSRFNELIAQGQVELVGTDSPSWLGVPLKTPQEIIGVMVVQHYEIANLYTEQDAHFLTSIAGQIALIVERKQSEEALLQFRKVMDESNDAVFMIDPQTSHYLDFNANALKFLGYNRQELGQLGVIDIAQHITHLDDWHKRVALVQEQGGLIFETVYRRKDNTTFPVEVSASMLDYGPKAIMVAIVRDISERKQAERELRQSKKWLQLAYETAELGSWQYNLLTEHFYLDDRAQLLYGFQNNAISFSNLLTHVHPADLKTVQENMATFAANKQGERLAMEYRVIHSGGQVRWLAVQAQGQFEASNKTPATIVATVQDITGRKEVEEHFRQHTARVHVLAEISQILAEVRLDYLAMLQIVARRISEFTKDICIIRLISDDGQWFEAPMVYHPDPTLRALFTEFIGFLYQPVAESMAAPVVKSGQALFIPVISSEALKGRVHKNFWPWLDQVKLQGIVIVPMRFQGRVIGTIHLVRANNPALFTLEEQSFLQDLADRAAMAVGNGMLFAETHSRAEEFAALYEVGQDLSGRWDLPRLLEVIVDHATYLLQTNGGGIYLYDPGRRDLYVAVSKGAGFPTGVRLRLGQGLAGRVAESNQPLMVDDYQKWPHRATHFEGIPIRGVLGVPMNSGGALIGVLLVEELGEKSERHFNVGDARLLSLLATQAASAVHNAHLFEETSQRLAELEAVSKISTALRTAQTWAEILPLLLDEALAIFNGRAGSIWLYDNQAGLWGEQLERGWPAGTELGLSRPEQAVMASVFTTGETYLSWADPTREMIPAGWGVCVPIRTAIQTIGAFYLALERELKPQEIRLLTTLTEIAGNALHRAEVIATLEQRVNERTFALAQANEQLKELDRLKSKFVSDVSHELRTPMANLSLYLSLLDGGKPEKRERYMQVLHEQAARLGQLIEDILDLSRLDAKTTGPAFEPFDLNEVLERAILAQQPKAQAKKIALLFRPGATLSLFYGSPHQIGRMITNLVANAINYTPAGQVIIQSKAKAGKIVITVQDSGIGIDPEDIPHLFERFYRGRLTSQSDMPGTGLGLAIVKEVVEAHQGQIEVESKPGQGSLFKVTLPIMVKE